MHQLRVLKTLIDCIIIIFIANTAFFTASNGLQGAAYGFFGRRRAFVRCNNNQDCFNQKQNTLQQAFPYFYREIHEEHTPC